MIEVETNDGLIIRGIEMTPGRFDGNHLVVYIHDDNDPLLQWPWYPLPDLATELQT